MPSYLPGSCFVGQMPGTSQWRDDSFHGWCRYKVKAKLDVDDGIIFDTKVKCSQEFTVLNIPSPPADRRKKVNTDVRICWCCCSKGVVSVDFWTSKDAFQVGDVVEVHCEFDNKSTADMEALHVILRRTVQLSAPGTTPFLFRTVGGINWNNFAFPRRRARAHAGVACYVQDVLG